MWPRWPKVRPVAAAPIARGRKTSNANLDRPSIKVFVPLAKPARKHARTAVKIMSGQQMGLKQLALLVHPDKSRHPRTGPSSRQGFRAQKCSCREAVVYVGFWGT